MRPTGKEGFLYGVRFGALLAGGANKKVPEDGWYKIKSIAEAGSGIPDKDPSEQNARRLREGDVYYAPKDQPLAIGDSLIPINIKKIAFTTDVGFNAQGQAIDITTQIDVETGSRAYAPSAFKEQSGNINGCVDVDSDEQRELANEFSQIITQAGGYVSIREASSRVHHFMISYRETKTPGETEMWRYFPVIIESFQMDKPVDGVIPFNFNYKVDGKNRPAIIYRTVEDAEDEPEEDEEGDDGL
jgi:hypothetical protein